jgi:hypothetical protein
MNDFTYFREDIEKWLDENEKHFERGSSPQEYAENAVIFHNSKKCKDRCECINPFNQVIKPRLHPDDQVWFKKVARKNYDLESWLTKPYLKSLRLLYKCSTTGCLVRLNDLYENYDRHPFLSPICLLDQKIFKVLIRYEIEEHDYRVEEVIQYDEKNVYAHPNIGLQYLHMLDIEQFVENMGLLYMLYYESEFLAYMCNNDIDD